MLLFSFLTVNYSDVILKTGQTKQEISFNKFVKMGAETWLMTPKEYQL